MCLHEPVRVNPNGDSLMRVNYTPAKRRIAKTDRIICSIMIEAALVDERKINNTYAMDKLEIHAAWFEARMKTLIEELEKYDDQRS